MPPRTERKGLLVMGGAGTGGPTGVGARGAAVIGARFAAGVPDRLRRLLRGVLGGGDPEEYGTRDTARPEGGGRAAPGDAPAPARQWPLLTVLGGTVTGLLIVAVGPFRIGAITVGLSLVAGAVLRRLLPSVGMLAVRSRFTDLVTYGTLGTVIVLLAMMAQPDPWIDIPWLKDVMRFTVR